MKPAPFRYFAPRSLDEATSILAEYGEDARILAGGQSLVPMMNARIAKPSVLVSINHAPELSFLRPTPASIRIGASARQVEIERSDDVARLSPLLHRAIRAVGTTATRNRGTVCGSLAHADPLAELPAIAVAVGARFTLARASSRRTVAAGDFFVGELTTAIEPDEMLAEVEFPAPAGPIAACGFAEIGNRRHGFAVAGMAGQFAFDERGDCVTARLVGIGYGPVPIRFRGAEACLEGRAISPGAIAEAADAAAGEATPAEDFHADAAYRKRVAPALLRRVIEEARIDLEASGRGWTP